MFKQECLTALRAGADYEALMELGRVHRSQGLSLDAAYESLQQIWLEHGFDHRQEEGGIKDTLEAVMEKVWYGFVA
jgi:hypothetical protein